MNSTTAINLFLSFASLLSGDPTDCLDPSDLSDETCVGGLASVASVIRHSRLRGDALYIPRLDRTSKFVQMHPEGWGVNKIIAQHFGWKAYFAPPSLFSSSSNGRDLSQIIALDFSPVMTNLDLSPMSPWFGYLEHVYFDSSTGTATIHIQDEAQPLTALALESMVAALDYIGNLNENSGCPFNDGADNNPFNDGVADNQVVDSFASILTSRCWSPIILFNELNKDQYNACVQAAVSHPYPPLVFYDSEGLDEDYYTPKIVNNRTVVFSASDLEGTVSHLHIEIAKYDRSITKLSFSEIELESLPPDFMDDEYLEDRKYLRKLADEAVENDPIVGKSGYMPFTREGEWRKCMGGECPIGNLFTDALRWATDADFAVLPSGGLRGPGWEEGYVHVGDLWAALPFSNTVCTGVMSGVSVYRLLNYSTAVATFESTYTAMGDRLLQMSGMRMTYNTLVNGTSGRLMSVEVWDKDTEQYLPLERLKLYSFVTDNWMCEAFDPYPDLFGSELQIEGEVPGFVDRSRNVQSTVGEYLSSINGTYDTSMRGSHINNTEAFDQMDFIQSSDSCTATNHFWEAKLLTCVPCPGGKFVKFSDELISFLITKESTDFAGRNVLYNRETFDVTIAPNYAPSWIIFKNLTSDALIEGSRVLQPGESVAIGFEVDASKLNEGNTRSTVSYGVVVDGDFPGCLTDFDIAFDVLVELRAEEDLNQIDRIRPVGMTFMALAMALSIFLASWTFKYRNHRVIKASQPRFLLIVCLGIFIIASSIVPLSIDDSIASQEGCSIACMATPWLWSTGFAVTVSSLVAKIWRLNKLTNSAMSFRRVEVKDHDALRLIVCLVLVNFVLLLCWTFVDPLQWQREPISENDPSKTYGFCSMEGNGSVVFLSLLLLINVSALVLLCVQAYRARKMDDELTESRWLGVACASWIQVLAVGLPVILLVQSDPVASYFTKAAIVFLVCTSMLLLIFLPKIKIMKKTRHLSHNSFNMRVTRAMTMRRHDSNMRATITRAMTMRRHDSNMRATITRSMTMRRHEGSTATETYQLRARIRQLEQLLEDATVSKTHSTKDLGEDVEEISSKEPPISHKGVSFCNGPLQSIPSNNDL